MSISAHARQRTVQSLYLPRKSFAFELRKLAIALLFQTRGRINVIIHKSFAYPPRSGSKQLRLLAKNASDLDSGTCSAQKVSMNVFAVGGGVGVLLVDQIVLTSGICVLWR